MTNKIQSTRSDSKYINIDRGGNGSGRDGGKKTRHHWSPRDSLERAASTKSWDGLQAVLQRWGEEKWGKSSNTRRYEMIVVEMVARVQLKNIRCSWWQHTHHRQNVKRT